METLPVKPAVNLKKSASLILSAIPLVLVFEPCATVTNFAVSNEDEASTLIAIGVMAAVLLSLKPLSSVALAFNPTEKSPSSAPAVATTVNSRFELATRCKLERVTVPMVVKSASAISFTSSVKEIKSVMLPEGTTSGIEFCGTILPTGAATIAIGVGIVKAVPALPAASEYPW